MADVKCSVVVPVYNQWDLVPNLLRCLYRQNLAQDCFEVLLVDNGSNDFSPPAALANNVALLECDTPGSYVARNFALDEARGEWLVFTDADCLPQPDWLRRLMQEAAKSTDRPSIVAGRVNVIALDGPPNAYQIYDMVKGIPQDWYVSRGYAATANLAVPADTMKALGGFDGSRYSGGDAEFCRRALAAGVLLRYAPSAVVEHPARDSWQALATKARRIKGGHLAAGSIRRRGIWVLRTFLPPIVAFLRFVCATEFSLRHRLIAVVIQTRIWGVEVFEVFRLLGSSHPERR